MSFELKLQEVVKRFEGMGEKLNNPGELSSKEFAKLSKEYSDMGELVEKIQRYQASLKSFKDSEELMNDASVDAEMKELAQEEFYELKAKLPEIEREIRLSLIPKDEADAKNAILEIRAGAGGDEAGLFAAELFRMYQKYATRQGWRFEILSISDTGIGGYKEASAEINGYNVFSRLKYESGVHRVQRVPATESGGRIHTSTATVAVLPEAEEVDIHIEEKDLRIDVFRSSGPGGQSVNTTDSAIRITHLPTGLVVSQQDEKSQTKNKAKGLKVLRARLYEMERAKKEAERSALRQGQIGTGDRSERIRTYNFPQGRVTDHRINLTVYNIAEIVVEGELDQLIEPLITEDQAAKLAEAI
ncbi:MAG: peptide chain release factor 1 [Proteobacteria bacterium]|nr:peptide chain release factor 1 [Pseudomonadota bacterium]